MPEEESKNPRVVPPEDFEKKRFARERRLQVLREHIRQMQRLYNELDERYKMAGGDIAQNLFQEKEAILRHIEAGVQMLENFDRLSQQEIDDYLKTQWKEQEEE